VPFLLAVVAEYCFICLLQMTRLFGMPLAFAKSAREIRKQLAFDPSLDDILLGRIYLDPGLSGTGRDRR